MEEPQQNLHDGLDYPGSSLLQAFLKSRRRATKTFGKKFLGVVGFEPRTPSLEHMCLPTRVQSNALMRTTIAV